MSDAQGFAWFPGVNQVRGCWYTLAHGIAPGVATLELAPQPGFTPTVGPLELSYSGRAITFPDCLVEGHNLELDGNGQVWRMTLLDRRWKWRYGQISGRYNQRRRDGSPIESTQKSPVELAQLCLAAMGEARYDLSLMPNTSRPAIDWNDEVPARALANLADALGCRVVLRLDNSVALAPAGFGAALPIDDDVQADSLSIETSERPGALVAACGASMFQLDFELEAVGLDADGMIRPIDQLSYRPEMPDGGGDSSPWKLIDLPHFNNIRDEKERERAQATVFRWYRIRKAKGSDLPADRYQLLSHRLDAAQPEGADESGPWDYSTPQVFGVWRDLQRNGRLENTIPELIPLPLEPSEQSKQMLWHGGFTIDEEQSLVRFDTPVYKLRARGENDGFEIEPAELILRTACYVRDPTTNAFMRYEYRKDLAGATPGAPARYVRQPSLGLRSIARYGDGYAVASIDDNRSQLDAACEGILAAVERSYSVRAPQTVTYVGLKPIDVDGAIRQVRWAITLSGTTTQACRDVDSDAGSIGYDERRFLEQ